ncbi:Enkurin like protein [Argiope bruennichi]|uniref:Enkurin like protein n=1 Tax=Argiope bruennichi TaxID=94029 RepID=A0A8T0EQE0_ARGBR|nr:Enkurin like protein [Argiope bruennichi]
MRKQAVLLLKQAMNIKRRYGRSLKISQPLSLNKPIRTQPGESNMMKPVTCLCRIKNGKDSPPIPKPHVMPLTLVQNGRRNFVEENIVEAVKHPPRIPTPKMVGSSREKAFSLDESGWVPKYSKIQDFVEVPSYIVKNKQHLRLSKEDFITAKHTQGELQSLSMESKQKILEGLVRNLKELLRRYLILPLKIDTPVLIKRKNDLENRIDALQRDIDLIRRNIDILIGKGKTDFSLQ